MIKDERVLDVEFRKHLQKMHPNLKKVVNDKAINICNAWIWKLANCESEEKLYRNTYAFYLSHQLACGALHFPFIEQPPQDKLEPYPVMEGQHETYVTPYSEEPEKESGAWINTNPNERKLCDEKTQVSRQVSSCRNLGEKDCKLSETLAHNCCYKHLPKDVDRKAEAPTIGTVLQELEQEVELKQDKKKPEILKQTTTENIGEDFHCNLIDFSGTIPITDLTSTDSSDQNSVTKFEENIMTPEEKSNIFNNAMKKEEQDVNKKEDKQDSCMILGTNVIHKAAAGDSTALGEIRKYYEEKIECIHDTYSKKLLEKDYIIKDKDEEINDKTKQIQGLENIVKESKENLRKIVKQLLRRVRENHRKIEELYKKRIHLLESKLLKTEKTRLKYKKSYVSKLAALEHENHLTNCSVQLQLVRQRTQAASEFANKTQWELDTAILKLESKYKDFVSKIQNAAIQRLQDQMSLESFFKINLGIDFPYETTAESLKGSYTRKIHEFPTIPEVSDSTDVPFSVVTTHRLDKNRLAELYAFC